MTWFYSLIFIESTNTHAKDEEKNIMNKRHKLLNEFSLNTYIHLCWLMFEESATPFLVCWKLQNRIINIFIRGKLEKPLLLLSDATFSSDIHVFFSYSKWKLHHIMNFLHEISTVNIRCSSFEINPIRDTTSRKRVHKNKREKEHGREGKGKHMR